VDADKSNFEIFVENLGLPARHKIIVALHEGYVEVTRWWVERTLHEAREGAEHAVIFRFIDVVKAVSGDANHPALREVFTILADRLAEATLAAAEKLRSKDAAKVAASTAPQPESALNTAESIKNEMIQAIALGASPKHSAMQQSKQIEVQMRMEEKNRLAEKLVVFARAARDKDQAAAEAAAPAVPPVGAASKLADSIEREVGLTVERGVMETDSRVQESKAIMKALRDEDGTRKRLAAREARLGAKAAG